jgi:hypothetical protein
MRDRLDNEFTAHLENDDSSYGHENRFAPGVWSSETGYSPSAVAQLERNAEKRKQEEDLVGHDPEDVVAENEKCANQYLEPGHQAVAARKTVGFRVDRDWHAEIVGVGRGSATWTSAMRVVDASRP